MKGSSGGNDGVRQWSFTFAFGDFALHDSVYL